MRDDTLITISVVGHAQEHLVRQVLADIAGFAETQSIEFIYTRNLPERPPIGPPVAAHVLRIIENPTPRGFGANHNAAFRLAKGEFFCVMNPDIRMTENPFPLLLDELERHQAAVVAPAVLSPTGHIEDSVRRFPTPFSLLGKLLGRDDGRYRFAVGDETFAAHWVGGMFMLFRAEDYRNAGGFDEGYFLYYEDVDICARLWKAGRTVLVCPGARVVHDARRTSRRNLRYMRWHAGSMIRYLGKHWLRLPRVDSP
jgi:GT2 family glycosyltransferase